MKHPKEIPRTRAFKCYHTARRIFGSATSSDTIASSICPLQSNLTYAAVVDPERRLTSKQAGEGRAPGSRAVWLQISRVLHLRGRCPRHTQFSVVELLEDQWSRQLSCRKCCPLCPTMLLLSLCSNVEKEAAYEARLWIISLGAKTCGRAYS